MIKLTFCSARNCKDFAYDRNRCHKHLAQRYRSDTFIPRINGGACLTDNCTNKSIGKGLCWKHYRRQLRSDHKRATWLCLIFHSFPYWQCHARGCKRFQKCKGYCQLHYVRWRKFGSPFIVKSQALYGMTGTPTYNSWMLTIQRCTNPKATHYENYGGRGIKVCDRWLRSFANFYADMEERPDGKTLHRIELDGDYEPGNCKWATNHEQALRRRLPNTNKSGYRGVHFHQGKWVTSIYATNTTQYLGRFKSKAEAARTYNQAALVHFGAEAMLNQVTA